jgi:hypothetical protein
MKRLAFLVAASLMTMCASAANAQIAPPCCTLPTGPLVIPVSCCQTAKLNEVDVHQHEQETEEEASRPTEPQMAIGNFRPLLTLAAEVKIPVQRKRAAHPIRVWAIGKSGSCCVPGFAMNLKSPERVKALRQMVRHEINPNKKDSLASNATRYDGPRTVILLLILFILLAVRTTLQGTIIDYRKQKILRSLPRLPHELTRLLEISNDIEVAFFETEEARYEDAAEDSNSNQVFKIRFRIEA